MSQYINLTDIVSPEKLKVIERYQDESAFITESVVRNKLLRYATHSKRQLWQAVGLEYIEPELLDYIDSLVKGENFYDIGASTGIFSIYAKNSGLNVFSFEPEAQNFALLEKNNYLNSNDSEGSLSTFNIALAESVGIGKMYIASYEAAGHMKILDTPKKVQENEEFTPCYIQTVLKYSLDYLLDEFNLPCPNYMKIDVDGSELALIKGAKNTIANRQLKSIFIELDEKSQSTKEIKSILLSNDFIEKRRNQVQNYEGLYNCIFERT